MYPFYLSTTEKQRNVISQTRIFNRQTTVGHTILVIIYHVLQDQKPYTELGGNYFDERNRQATERRLVRRLEKLGYEVSLKSAPPAA